MKLAGYIENFFIRVLSRPAIVRAVAQALSKQYVIFGDENRLRIARSAVVHNALFNLSSGRIEVGEKVFFGHHVCLVTGTHDYHLTNEARATAIPAHGRDIIIQEGAWIASNVTVVGPAQIGAYAVVGAGAVVTGDVAPYTVVVGVPARVVHRLNPTRE
jgi:acetyltransferase-like isoleucine patch superfamily enzyme